MKPTARRRRAQRGGVFIVTLGVMTALILLLSATVISQREAMRAEANRLDRQRAELAAMTGVQRAIATLATQAQSPTLSTDDWASLGTQGSERFLDGSTTFRMQIIDGDSLININTANQAQLQKLPLTQEQIDCILDFREAARISNRTDGAKDTYYNALQNPYNTKLLPFESVDELLQVKGFTPEVLYTAQSGQVNTAVQMVADQSGNVPVLADLLTVDSSSRALSVAGAGLPSLQTANIQAIQRATGSPAVATQIFQRRGTLTTWSAVLGVPGITTAIAKNLVNAFRVGTSATQTGKINLNTVTENVLNTIPNLSTDVVSAIITRQSTGFTQLGDLFDVPGYTPAVARQSLDQFTVNSQIFIIRVVGIAGTTRVPLQVTVKISANQPPQIIRIEHPPQPDVVTAHWGWASTTSTDTDLKGSQ